HLPAAARTDGRQYFGFRISDFMTPNLWISIMRIAASLEVSLSNNLIEDLSMHIRESERAALVAISQPLVVEAQQMQHRGVQIVHVHRLRDDVLAKFIRSAVG